MGKKVKRRSWRVARRARERRRALEEARPDIDWQAVQEYGDLKFGPEGGIRSRKRVKTAVYLMSASADGPTKVGVATDVEKRLCQLQTGHAYPLALHLVMWFSKHEAALTAEQWLLREVDASARLTGEWIGMRPAILREMLKNFANKHLSGLLLNGDPSSNEE